MPELKTLEDYLIALSDGEDYIDGSDIADSTYDMAVWYEYRIDPAEQDQYDRALQAMARNLPVVEYAKNSRTIIVDITAMYNNEQFHEGLAEFMRTHTKIGKRWDRVTEDDKEEYFTNVLADLSTGNYSDDDYVELREVFEGQQTFDAEYEEHEDDESQLETSAEDIVDEDSEQAIEASLRAKLQAKDAEKKITESLEIKKAKLLAVKEAKAAVNEAIVYLVIYTDTDGKQHEKELGELDSDEDAINYAQGYLKRAATFGIEAKKADVIKQTSSGKVIPIWTKTDVVKEAAVDLPGEEYVEPDNKQYLIAKELVDKNTFYARLEEEIIEDMKHIPAKWQLDRNATIACVKDMIADFESGAETDFTSETNHLWFEVKPVSHKDTEPWWVSIYGTE